MKAFARQVETTLTLSVLVKAKIEISFLTNSKTPEKLSIKIITSASIPMLIDRPNISPENVDLLAEICKKIL